MTINLKYILSLVFIISLGNYLTAQNPPGYMGKRLYVNMNIYSALTYKGPTKNNKGLDSDYIPAEYSFVSNSTIRNNPSLALNLRYEFGIRYIIGNKVQIGVNYGRLKTGFNMYSPYTGYRQHIPIFYTANVNTLDLSFDFSKNIAPLGSYFVLGPGLAFGKGQYSDSNFFINEPSSIESDKTIILPYLRTGFGIRKVLFDKMIIKTGIDCIMNFTPVKTFSTDRSDSMPVHYKEEFKARIARHLFFNVSVGIGYLIL